jgi:hypothetical protein
MRELTMSLKPRRLADRRQRGLGLVAVVTLIAVITLLLLFFGAIFLPLLGAPGGGRGRAARDGRPPFPTSGGALPGNPPDARPPIDETAADFGGAGLACVDLPGVNHPRTPALDRRVARRFYAVMNEMKENRISLRFTWGFRTNCQQIHVDSGGNLKAMPGTSPHEAGRAVDVSGMLVHPRREEIIAVFRRHGWLWLGRKDPPHFEVLPSTVGEVSKIGWIQKIQSDFRAGGASGCRGTDCGQ